MTSIGQKIRDIPMVDALASIVAPEKLLLPDNYAARKAELYEGLSAALATVGSASEPFMPHSNGGVHLVAWNPWGGTAEYSNTSLQVSLGASDKPNTLRVHVSGEIEDVERLKEAYGPEVLPALQKLADTHGVSLDVDWRYTLAGAFAVNSVAHGPSIEAKPVAARAAEDRDAFETAPRPSIAASRPIVSTTRNAESVQPSPAAATEAAPVVDWATQRKNEGDAALKRIAPLLAQAVASNFEFVKDFPIFGGDKKVLSVTSFMPNASPLYGVPNAKFKEADLDALHLVRTRIDELGESTLNALTAELEAQGLQLDGFKPTKVFNKTESQWPFRSELAVVVEKV